MKILLLVRPQSACDYHRIVSPFRYFTMESGEHMVTKEEGEEIRVGDFKGTDLVIFNRHPTIPIETLLGFKKRYGFKIWVDIDDYWELYPEHYLYDSWKREKIGQKIIDSISIADIVTTTNKRLLRKILPINHNTVVIPNAVPVGYEQFMSDKSEATRVRFMYAGGPSHVKDLMIIEQFFKNIAQSLQFYQNAEFILAGYSDRYREPTLMKMNSIMSIAPRYSTRLGMPVHKYMEHYNNADVSLAPLADNDFNIYKSNLKIIEAGCMRMPIICSSMYPFLEDLEMKNTGVFFCNTILEWHDACKLLIEHPERILTYGTQLYEYVKANYDLLKINHLRRDIINSFKK